MAKLIQAVHEFGPRLALARTTQTTEIAELIGGVDAHAGIELTRGDGLRSALARCRAGRSRRQRTSATPRATPRRR